MVNKAILLGRLGQDPELKKTANDLNVCRFSVATQYKYKEDMQTTWHNIVLFGKAGEYVMTYLKKGSLVYVEVMIQTRTWQGKDGKKHTTTEILAKQVQGIKETTIDTSKAIDDESF